MAYGVFTDAATRFTKNQSPLQNMAVIAKAADDIRKIAGGRLASQVIDIKGRENREMSVKTTFSFINSRLGLDLSAAEMKKLLENVEFKVGLKGPSLTITCPFWRTDIAIPEDIAEEVGRLYGYDRLPLVLPRRDIAPAAPDQMLDLKARLRGVMQRAGANEALTYSFVHESLLKKAGQDTDKAYHIRNAISPDLQYYRLSLMPSLLEKVRPNIKAGFDKLCLFEIGKVYVKAIKDDEKLPAELERLALTAAARQPLGGEPYYWSKVIIGYLLHELGVTDTSYRPMAKLPTGWQQTAAAYEPGRSAAVYAGDEFIGLAGEPSQNLRQSLKLPKYTAQAEIDLGGLLKLVKPLQYRPINKFPELEQDFCLRSDAGLPYRELEEFMTKNLNQLSAATGYQFSLEPLDIYQRPDDKKHKQTTWRIILWHPERTLTTDETNKLLDELADRAKKELKAERV